MRTTTPIPIPASAIADRDLSDGAFRVLLYLAHRTADGSELVMRHQDIAAELNRSISTVAQPGRAGRAGLHRPRPRPLRPRRPGPEPGDEASPGRTGRHPGPADGRAAADSLGRVIHGDSLIGFRLPGQGAWPLHGRASA